MEWIIEYFADFSSTLGAFNAYYSYFIIFSVLTLCGLGLPVPEDIVLIAAGLFVYHDKANINLMILVSLFGVLAGDYLIFYIGSKWGIRFLNHRIFRDAFSEERIKKVHEYFDKYGNKTIFIARFIWGLRAATFFIAGTHTMSAIRFLALDLLGALISIPLIIYVAYYFGGEIQRGIYYIKSTNHIILIIILCIIAYLVIKHRRKNKNSSEHTS